MSGGLGEAEVGGPAMSIVPKTGGNTIKGSVYFAGVSEGMVDSNYTQELRRRPEHAGRAAEVLGLHRRRRRSDHEGSPLVLPQPAQSGIASSVSGMFANLNAGDPTKWTYQADLTRQSRSARAIGSPTCG